MGMYLDFHLGYTEYTFVNVRTPACCYWECGFSISGDMHTQVASEPRPTVTKVSLSALSSQHGRSHFVQIVRVEEGFGLRDCVVSTELFGRKAKKKLTRVGKPNIWIKWRISP